MYADNVTQEARCNETPPFNAIEGCLGMSLLARAGGLRVYSATIYLPIWARRPTWHKLS